MDNIVVADKQSAQLTQNAWGNISLNGPGLVQMPVAPDQVATVTRDGQNLIVTLKSGEKVTIGNFFEVDQAGVGSDMVFVGEDGTLWHAVYDADAFTGFTFESVASLDELMADIGVVGSATPTWAIAGLSLLGVGGAAAASGGNGGGSSDSGTAPSDTAPPATPIDLLVSSNGLRLSGAGEAGSTVTVRDAAGNPIGTGTVGADGRFDVALDTPQTNGENLDVTLTDGAGNISDSGNVTAPDTTAPFAPTDLAINEQGNVLTGRAEPGATIEVRGADDSVLGSALVGADGLFSVTLDPAQIDGQALQVTASDATGNTSDVASITAPDTDVPPGDTTPPGAPTDLLVSADGRQVSGRGEAGTTVQVRDANGTLIATGTVAADGTFALALDPAVIDGSTLQINLTDAAGNVSQPGSVASVDLTAPAQPSNLAVSADGSVLTGRGEPGSTIRVVDAQGNQLGTAVVNAAGSFTVTLDPPQVDGQELQVTAADVSGNISDAASVTAPNVEVPGDTTPPDAPTDLVISAGGRQISGRGEAGTTVQVRDADGTIIATGTVAADGTFALALDPAVIDGSTLQVDLTDAAGNVSQPGSVASSDLTAPAQPTDLALADGVTLTGSGEPGATVQVRDATGAVIGSAVVGDDGRFSLTLTPAQANGEALDVRQVDAAGNSSQPLVFDAPDITPPAAVSSVVVSADGLTVSGRGEPGATVEVRDADGTVIGTGTVGDNGTFVLTLDSAIAAGDLINLIETDAAGNASPGFDFTVPDSPAPATPTELILNEDGSVLTGTATPGNRVEVRGADGTLLGSGVAGADGSFSITLDPAQANGELLDVVAIDAADQSSIPGQITAPDITAPAEPTELAVSADGSVLTGRGEPGSTIRVVDAQGNQLGTAVVNAAGSFAITLDPPQVAGQELQVTAADSIGNTSDASSVTAPNLEIPGDTTPPDAPTDLVISAGGRQISGRGEAGTTVQVRDADGTIIATGTVAADGTFALALDPAVIDGSTLQVDLTDAAGNVSQPGSVASSDLTAPAQPTDLALADGVTLTGSGEPGATVQVRDATGAVIGSAVVGDDGRFSLTLTPAQANGEALDVRQVDAAGNSSQPLVFDAPDITPPAAVSGVVVSADGLTVSGRGEPGATVEVRDADGTVIGTGTVGDNGTFVLTLDSAIAAGDLINLIETDAAGNASPGFEFTVPNTPAPASPADLAFNDDGSQLTGSATAGTRVEARDANGTLLGSATAGVDGTFTITLAPAQANGELLDVVAIDAADQSSIPGQITAPDITAPAEPTELAVSADGSVLTGRGEPGSTIRVVDAQGNQLGTAVVNAAGSFAITLDPPQVAGQELQVTAADSIGNTSDASSVTAPSLEIPGDTTPPDAPTDLVISGDGKQVSGRGEAGATVQVRNADGTIIATGTVAADGTFALALDPAVIDGSTLQVDLTDAAGNVSQPGSVASSDLTAPAQPTDLALADGVTLTGSGEPGATVQVRDATGAIIGSAVVAEDGSFSVTLNPAQANGEALDVRQVDAAGNSSQPLVFDAPDITPPAAVSSVVVSADGLTVSGRGEPGATVEVRDADGTVIGTGTVSDSGTFVLTLDSAIAAGDLINLIETDAAGNASPGFEFTVPDTPAPASPADLAFNDDGSQLTGSATAGTRVEARDANGTLLGSATAGVDGTFTITLAPAQANGELVDVVAIDAAGQSSIPAQATAPDITAPAEPTELAISADGSVITGRGEPGSTIRVVDAQGNQLGTAMVNATGSFAITLDPPQVAGQELQVTAADNSGNTSEAASIAAPIIEPPVDTTAPIAPTDLVISADGKQVSGRGESGTIVQVRDAEGTIIATGTVAADGTFALALDPAVVDGSTLQVDLTDAAGNVSEPGSVTSTDLTAPEQPTDLTLTDGLTLTGSGEAGATVQVRDAAGTLIGSAVVGDDGQFTLTLNPAQANGEVLDIRQTDVTGNSSQPLVFDASDITPPAAVSGVVVSADGLTVSGRGEPGATVEVRDADGTVIGTGTVGDNGTFVLTLDSAIAAGDLINLIETDAAGNASPGFDFTVPDSPAPATPTELILNEDGSVLTGTATPGNRVEVRSADGTLLGSGVAGADGSFSITLDPAQANGELLDVVAIDAADQSSIPGQITAPDITAPAEPTELAVSADGSVITGRGEPGSTIRVVDAQGNQLGTAVVNAAGSFAITLDPPQVAGQELQVTAADSIGNTSEATSITAPIIEPPVDTTAPIAPTDLVISADGKQVSGRGESGTTVQVRDAEGTIIATGTVAADGTFALALDPAVVDGSTLQVDLTDAAGNVSEPGSVTFTDLTAPEQPTGLTLTDGLTLTGSGEAGATVQVRDAAGTVIGSAVVGDDGQFTLTLNPAQANGEVLDIRQTDVAGNSSQPLVFDAPDITPPAAVSGVVVSADGLTLSGRGEIGASVEVRDAEGTVIGTGTVGANGTFVLTLDSAIAAGDLINLIETDAAGNASPGFEFTVPDTPAPASPADLAFNDDGSQLTGSATAGTRVEARDANGTLLGSATVGVDGTFTITLAPAQANGELVDVVAIDAAGQSSIPAQATAPDITAPAEPSELAISADGSVITGRGEPGSTIRVVDAQGNELGTALVNTAGSFAVTLDPAQIQGEQLQVSATDAAGNASDAAAITAPVIELPVDTTPPLAPADLVLTADGRQLTGRGESGTTVQVRDADDNVIASGTVAADGTFTLTLIPAVADGSTLQVSLTDAAGNVSPETAVISPDLTAPVQPTDLELANGVTLTGTGEAGATVEVRDTSGTLIGSSVVGDDGRFSVTLAPVQANGETLDIRLQDASGNISAPLVYTAPDITAPTIITGVVVSADGGSVSGRGEAGAIVEVRDAQGTVIGGVTVGTNGTFVVTLDPPVAAGDAVSLVQTDTAGNASPILDFTVPATPAPSSPTGLALSEDGTQLTGSATAGNRVDVLDADGNVIASGVAGVDGSFTITLDPAQANGEELDVVAVDAAGQSSIPTLITAPDITAPAEPGELVVSNDGAAISGRGEPGSTIRVVNAEGVQVAIGQVNAAGSFSLTLDPVQVAGEQLQVTAADATGNTSDPTSVTAPDLGLPPGEDTTPPTAATDLVISPDGRLLSGQGEANAVVQILDAEGNVIATGTVGLDGTFSIALDPAVIDGSTLEVNLTDAADNTSANAPVTSPDLTAPEQPADLQLVDGITFTGAGEAGARVEVRDASGTLIGSGEVGDDGRFSLTLSPAQANGEALDIRLVDGEGNISTALLFTAPDITPPAIVSGIVVSADGLAISGRGERGARVEVRDSEGTLIGSGTVGANGTFLLTLDTEVAPGDSINLIQIDPSDNESDNLQFSVPIVPAPASPSEVTVAEDGSSVSGTAPAGTQVQVRDSEGEVIGSVAVGAEGTFVIGFNPAQANGEVLDVVVVDGNGNSSLPVQITAPDITAPSAPAEVTVSADGTVVTGRAEAGSTVRVLDADGNELGNANANAAGSFSITLDPPQIDGETLQVTATDGAENTSTATAVTAPDIDVPGGDNTPPEAPTEVVISLDGRVVSGRGEVGATVQVLDDEGNILVTGTVLENGTFTLELDPPVVDGTPLQVNLTDAAGNESASTPLPTPDQIAPAQPVDLDLTGGAVLTGSAEAGARVEVRDANGTLLGSAVVELDGTFSVTLDEAQNNGEALDIRVIDASENTSDPLPFNAPDTTAPDVIGNVVIGTDGLTISGRGEVGAFVEVRNAENIVIGSGTVGSNGTFIFNLDPAVAPGDAITLVQSDEAGNDSELLTVTVPDAPVPASPGDVVLAEDGTSISGNAPPGTEVQVRDAQGDVLGSIVAGNDGAFTIGLTPPQANGETLDVVAVDGDGNSSLPTQVTAPDITAPNAATELALNPDGVTLTGRGEVGATVQVTNAQGEPVGSGVVNASGVFVISLSPAQTDGQVLDVTLTDINGNDSVVSSLTAPDLDGPLQPSGFAMDTSGVVLTGVGQAGSTITVRAADGTVLGTSTVAANGVFSVTLDEPQRNGQALTVEATDSRGNSAGPVDYTAPDTQPPALITEQQIDETGTLVSGQGEPGATVTVRAPNGDVLGSDTVNGDGSFAVSLDPAQTNGQPLTLEQQDAAGNVSAPVGVAAPDNETPEAPAGLTLSLDGSVLTGTGEPGTTVTVTGTGAAVLGTAVVASDGSFRVTLAPAQLNGQTLSATQADAEGNTSDPATVLAQDLQAPAAAQELALDDTGAVLSGRGEPGSTVEVRDPDGVLLGSVEVTPQGTFSVALVPQPSNGEILSVVVIDGENHASPAATIAAVDTTEPAIPTGLAVNAAGNLLTGTGEAGATVEVRNAAGDLLGSILVPIGGSFAVPLDPAQVDGGALSVTLTDASDNASEAASVTAPDITPPIITGVIEFSPEGTSLSGTSPGASSVTVRDGNGNEIITVDVDGDGTFVIDLPVTQNNGQTLTVETTDGAGNTSTPVTVTAPDLIAPEAAENVTLSPDGSSVAGTAEPGATVIVRAGDTELGSVVAGSDGAFVIPINPPLASGDTVEVVVRDSGDNETSIPLDGPDGTEIDTPTELNISADGFVLSGQGTVGSIITVTSADAILGTATVGGDGTFRVFFSNAQLNAQSLHVYARSASGGKLSVPASVVAEDTTAPDAPTALAVDRSGSVLTGRGEVGATINVVDVNGTNVGTGVVGSNGLFSVTLVPAQVNAQTLTVTQVDSSNNTSLATTAKAPDLLAPEAAGGLSFNGAATVVRGEGEIGAMVTVRDASGAVLATGIVNQSGEFQITLPNAQTTGAALQVTLTDAAGNTSAPASLTTPDRTPPAAVGAPLLSADGKQLSGTGEAGANIQVRNAAGIVLGTATVGADGRFIVTFENPQINGQALGVAQIDAAGNTSPATTVATPDLTAPVPLTNVVLNNNGLTLTGLGEAGSTVTVRGPDGTIIGTGNVAANGSFTLTLNDAQLNAERLSVTQTDAGNNTSAPTPVTAPDLTPPAAPTALALATTGLQLNGSAEAGSTVTVRDALGNVLGTAVAGSNGIFQVTLDSAQTNGQALQVTATDAAGNVSAIAPYNAADTTAPNVASNLAVSADGATLAGYGEAGASVTVSNADGTPLGTTVVGSDGSFSVTLDPAATAGDTLSVVLTDAYQNTSPAITVAAPGALAPDVPSNLVLADNGLSVTGSGTPGSTVNVYGPNGVLLGTALVGEEGTFTAGLGSAQANGETLQVGAVGTDGSASLTAQLIAPDNTAPQPLSQLTLSSDGLVLTGRGEPGATVSVLGEGGIELGAGAVNADGTFSIDLATAQINGEQLSASQADAAGNQSNSVNITAPDRVAPDAPADLAFTAGGTLLTGTGEAGTRISVLAADGTEIGRGTVRDDGTFQLPLDAPQANGEAVRVVLTDAAGNQSDASDLTANDSTAPAVLTELAIASDGAILTGRGEVGAEVTVTGPGDTVLGTAVVDATGDFTIALDPPLGDATLLTLTQTDAAGNISPAATLLTPDFTPPAPLTNVVINTDGSVVVGNGEAGATVTVTNAAGAVLGTSIVLGDTTFRVELDPPQINNEPLTVQQADPPGNVSEPIIIDAPDLTPPPAPLDLRFNATGDQLGGTGEAGTVVRVTTLAGVEIGTGTVSANGTFLIDLDTPQLNGGQLLVTLEDASDNVSPSSAITAIDSTPPAPVDAIVNASGTQLTGTGEAGARLTVLNDTGDLVGRGTIDLDGTFVLTLDTAQQNGQVLSIIAQDATGNPSTPFTVNAPDSTPPAQPTDLLLAEDGLTLTGSAEAGSTVVVRGPDNSFLGEVVADPDGTFEVVLTLAQTNGQTLTVVTTDEAGNSSLPQTVIADDTTAPDAVTNLSINTDYTLLVGRGEPGATVTVSQGDTPLGTAVVADNGTFVVELDPAATPGALLSVGQADEAGNDSPTESYTTPLEPVPATPTDVLLAADGLTISGTATPNSDIRVYAANGDLLGTGEAGTDGSFSFELASAQLNGELLDVTASSTGGESQPFVLVANDITPPAAPIVTALSANGLVLSGTGEAGATVTVRGSDGAPLGTGEVNAGGVFSITLDSAQLNGQVLALTQEDASGNGSGNTSFTAPDVQAPVAPANLAVIEGGTVLTGTGEAGARVTVLGTNNVFLGNATVGANGQFSVTLAATQDNGQVLTVRQTDTANNVSGSASVTAPDTTPPAAPTATINANGTAISGTGQAGSTITVRNSLGAVVGTATVGINGLFVVSLATAQVDFQTLSVSQTDLGGTSPGTTVIAPDFTPPPAAADLAVSADGSVLTGTGEAGASVTVRLADGTLLANVTVQPNGVFTVNLSPVQDNGQQLTVTLTDPRNNVSGNATIAAPDVDADRPVVASDNLAQASVDITPVVSVRNYTDSFTTLLAGFSKEYTWTVAAGTTADPTLTLTTSSALALLDRASFTLQVKDASGAWVTLADGASQGLLDLILLPLGQGLRVELGEQLAGEYRLIVGSAGIGVLTTVTTSLDVEITSLTQFTGVGTATSGNVLTDAGTDGTPDITGPDNAAVLQVLKGGSYVSAGTATTVQGLYGSLVIRGDGSYTYTPNGSATSIGKVDVFSYKLVHQNGLSDTANLYVRIDSPDASEIWSDTNYGAPATVVDAVNDFDSTSISLINRDATSTSTFAPLSLPVLGQRTGTYTTTVANDTTADLQVVLNSNNLLALLNGASIELLKLNPATGQYVRVQVVSGGALVSLLGSAGSAYTFQDQGPGSYQIKVTAGGIGLASSVTTTLNTTTTFDNDYVVGSYTPIIGNLVTDAAGADYRGSALTILSVLVAANTFVIPGHNGVSVAGTYGTLFVQADGTYSYLLKTGLTSAVIGQQDVFTYELTHPNGTSDTATLTIDLDNAATVAARASLLDASVDDDGSALASVAAASIASDDIQGTDGDDRLDGSQGGAVSLHGGAGDDTLVIVDQNFASVEGGSGTDTLLWAGGDASIDLGSLVGRVHDIEVIDLNDTSSVALTLNLADVVAVTESGNDTLLIKGGSEDSVHLTDNWALGGNETADGVDYNQYTAQEDPSHHLWVQNGIHVV